MRSYGDKPPEFLRKVPSGLLPVLELDGQFITESLVIMQVLDDTFADGHPNRMIPPKDSSLFDEANRLLGLERKLFGAWCSYLFRPGGLLGDGRREFESQLNAMDEKLGKHEGPWFLPGDAPTLVDLQVKQSHSHIHPAARGSTNHAAVCDPRGTHERVVPLLEGPQDPRERPMAEHR